VIDHLLGEQLARIVGDMLLQQPAQQAAAAGDRETDRREELIAERSVIYT